MNILFDITHPAHINLFKYPVLKLAAEGHKVKITALNRGRLPAILKTELPDTDTVVVGERPDSKFGLLWESNLKRTFQLRRQLTGFRPAIVVSSESIPVLLAARAGGIPSLLFSDDPERPAATFLKLAAATKAYYPRLDFHFSRFKKKIDYYHALKQWAYLAPAQLNPDAKHLEPYGVQPGEYFFVREVTTSSLNYAGQQAGELATIAQQFPKGYRVLFSLEDKSARGYYPESWTLLEEPLEDIHSLMYYSKAVISSGDSMAREGAMMGVPSFYTGIREMSANKVMMEKKMLVQIPAADLPDQLQALTEGNAAFETQKDFIRRLDGEWINLTEFIISKIKEHAKK